MFFVFRTSVNILTRIIRVILFTPLSILPLQSVVNPQSGDFDATRSMQNFTYEAKEQEPIESCQIVQPTVPAGQVPHPPAGKVKDTTRQPAHAKKERQRRKSVVPAPPGGTKSNNTDLPPGGVPTITAGDEDDDAIKKVSTRNEEKDLQNAHVCTVAKHRIMMSTNEHKEPEPKSQDQGKHQDQVQGQDKDEDQGSHSEE